MGQPFRIVIVSVEDDRETLTAHIRSTISEAEEITGLPMDVSVEQAAEITDAYRGGGWGENTEESQQAVLSFARSEGIFIENVYTSKVLVGDDGLDRTEKSVRPRLLFAYRRARPPYLHSIDRGRGKTYGLRLFDFGCSDSDAGSGHCDTEGAAGHAGGHFYRTTDYLRMESVYRYQRKRQRHFKCLRRHRESEKPSCSRR